MGNYGVAFYSHFGRSYLAFGRPFQINQIGNSQEKNHLYVNYEYLLAFCGISVVYIVFISLFRKVIFPNGKSNNNSSIF